MLASMVSAAESEVSLDVGLGRVGRDDFIREVGGELDSRREKALKLISTHL